MTYRRWDNVAASDHGMVRAYIGLGSNLDHPEQQLKKALTSFDAIPATCLVDRSSLYRSRPLGPQDQPDFVNAVAALDTRLPPLALLHELQAIEQQHGRDRSVGHWGPRTLDLDLLLYGDMQLATADLTLPHPGLLERSFALFPLYEIAPALEIVGRGAVRYYLERCPGPVLERLEGGL